MRVPPYHQSLLALAGLTEADLVGLFSSVIIPAPLVTAGGRILYPQRVAQMQHTRLQQLLQQ
jgi:hypothetical protein